MDAKMLGAGASGTPTTDSGPTQATSFGVAGQPYTSTDLSGGAVAVTDAPVGGLTLVILDFIISTDTILILTLTEETTGNLVAKFYLAANSVTQITPRGKKKLLTAGKRVFAQTSGSGNISIDLGYYSEG